jgi:hypothetical protein
MVALPVGCTGIRTTGEKVALSRKTQGSRACRYARERSAKYLAFESNVLQTAFAVKETYYGLQD